MRTSWLVALAACSSHAKPAEDGARTAPRVVEGAHVADAAPAPVANGAPGDLQIRVEWHDVPAALRASPKRTACGTAAPADVAPTTTWGVPEVFVMLSGERAKPADAPARVVVERCAIAPRAIVAGSSLAIVSSSEQPLEGKLVAHGSLTELATLPAGTPRAVQLPIAGHEVTAALDAGAYELAFGDASAWIVAAPRGHAGVTDAAGQVVLRDLPSGSYEITAWLPPRAGQPGKLAHGEAKVTAGALAEVTVDLAAK